jgi:hypothetical protein
VFASLHWHLKHCIQYLGHLLLLTQPQRYFSDTADSSIHIQFLFTFPQCICLTYSLSTPLYFTGSRFLNSRMSLQASCSLCLCSSVLGWVIF